jgi:hypothetical protein
VGLEAARPRAILRVVYAARINTGLFSGEEEGYGNGIFGGDDEYPTYCGLCNRRLGFFLSGSFLFVIVFSFSFYGGAPCTWMSSRWKN